MARAGLAQRAADYLLDLHGRPHALVDISKPACGIIPSFLQAQVENDVPVIARGEYRKVLIAT